MGYSRQRILSPTDMSRDSRETSRKINIAPKSIPIGNFCFNFLGYIFECRPVSENINIEFFFLLKQFTIEIIKVS